MQSIVPVVIASLVIGGLVAIPIVIKQLLEFFRRRHLEREAWQHDLTRQLSSLGSGITGVMGQMDKILETLRSPETPIINRLSNIENRLPPPEVVKVINESMGSLATAVSAAAGWMERQTDNTFLVAKGANEVKQAVQALRMAVFGDRRAENFDITRNENEDLEAANTQFDIEQLMLDHKLSRREAEARVRDAYAHRNSR